MEEQSFGRPYSSIILPTFFPVSPSIPEENRTLLLKPYIYTDTSDSIQHYRVLFYSLPLSWYANIFL